MKTRFIAIPLLAFAAVSCEKAKDLANKATSALKHEIAAKTGGSDDSAIVDPELQKLVDQTAEGAIFRKDLPFPKRLDVRTTRRNEMSGRLMHSSAIEKQIGAMTGTLIEITRLERAGDQVRYSLEQSSFSIPNPDNPEAEKKTSANPLDQVAPTTRPVTFRKSGTTWKSDESDGFRAAVLSKQLTPVLEQLLIESALYPRPQWFAKRRIKVGDQIIVAGDSLPMLLAGNARGSLTLKLESFDAVEGHPCGVFSITGDYSRKQFPNFDGELADEDVTIQSGKIWLSLIHPLVLKEELQTVQTFRSGEQGGLLARGQGTMKISVKRDWKPLAH